ncbi:HopJ type III effector protein [Mucilaginibacter mali]|uniref:HopJ type III effector protein n=1 Tax=Mucilaginibacter mali TaxID=2740462 RepID=A0A7D4PTS9_9SPHI|nr:HopJ type III effector protein [Mucilaginibacter mali]QKJ30228.1 HopJ type III effector protein [Mucilaginibacter mali]
MNEQTDTLIKSLQNGSIAFKDVLEFIDARYQHQPTAFKNGDAYNEATQNQGSARVFSFARINELSKEDTLQLFAEHYQAVLNTPDGTDHQNIRQFMTHGWDGIVFEGEALTEKQ